MTLAYAFQEEFSSRKKHVKRYLALVLASERRTKLLSMPISDMSNNVLRAGTFLVLYNLVEASVRNAIEAIHDELNQQRVRFETLRPSLRREIVKGFMKNGSADRDMNMRDVPCEFVTAALNVQDHFSGNVDARLVREIAEIYGFSYDTQRTKTRNGAQLLTVKNIRNDLAHGVKSYDQVGRDYTARTLLDISLRTTIYTEEILSNVAAFLNEKTYLEVPPPAQAAA
jgi:hypothetical protein